MSSENGQSKIENRNSKMPQTDWCRRRELMKWKGWSRDEVRELVAAGTLKTKRLKKMNRSGKRILGRRYYLVESAEKL